MIVQIPSFLVNGSSACEDAGNTSNVYLTASEDCQAVVGSDQIVVADTGASVGATSIGMSDTAEFISGPDVVGALEHAIDATKCEGDSFNTEHVAPLLNNTHLMVTRYKVGIFKPKVGSNYHETFSPEIKANTVRMMLAVAISQ